MPSSWQTVDMPFTGGLYEKAQPELAPYGTFAKLENLTQFRDGSLQKRRGLTSLTKNVIGGATINSGSKIMARKDAPLIVGTDTSAIWQKLFAYSPTALAWAPIGLVPPCGVARAPAVGLQIRHDFADIAYTNGYYVVAWSVPDSVGGNAHLYAKVIDSTGGESPIPVTLLTGTGGGNNPLFKMVSVGTFVFVVWGFEGGTELRYIKLDTANIGNGWGLDHQLPNTTNIGTVLTTFDVFGGTSQFYVAYVIEHAGARDQIDIRAYDTTAVQQSEKTSYQPFGAGNQIGAVGIGGDQNNIIWVSSCFVDAAVIGLSPSNVNTVNSAQGTVMINVHGSSVGVLWTTTNAGHLMVNGSHGTTQTFWRGFADSAGTVGVSGTSTRNAYRICPVSRQFLASNGRIYAHMQEVTATAGQSSQNVAGLLDLTDSASSALTPQLAVPAAVPAPRLAALPNKVWFPGSANGHQALSHVAVLTSTLPGFGPIYSIPMGVLKNAATGAGSGAASTLDICSYDFGASSRWMNGGLGESFVFGPQPYTFDGADLFEIGFWAAPTITTAVVSGTLTLAAGNYTFVALYEDVNGAGCVDWSTPTAPSNTYTSPGGANSSARVTVSTLQVTARHGTGQIYPRIGSRPRIVLYCSKDGSAYQRVTGFETANDPTVDTITVEVTSFDPSAPQMYTTPGATAGGARLARQIPAPLNVLIAHNDRYFGISDSWKDVWFSGQYIYGEATWFSSAFQFPVDAGRPLTALGSAEGRLWVYKRDRIFYVDGDGPDDTGGGFYPLPQEFPCGGNGCVEPRSVINTPNGQLYQSDQGIYATSRGGDSQFIGRFVEQTTLTVSTVTSAVLQQGAGRVHFTCDDFIFSGTNARRPSFDLVHQQWSMDRPKLSSNDLRFVSACMVGGTIPGRDQALDSETWYGLAADGTVYPESPNFKDINAWQTSTLTTGWIPFDAHQGFQRVRWVQVLFLQATGHDLTLQIAYDYNPTIIDTVTFTAAQIASAISGGYPEQIGCECSRQKIQALQITITDATPSSGSVGIAKGPVFLGLSFELRAKGGNYRLPPAQTA